MHNRKGYGIYSLCTGEKQKTSNHPEKEQRDGSPPGAAGKQAEPAVRNGLRGIDKTGGQA